MRLPDLVRDEVVLSARTWVVKVGTNVLTGPDGTLDPAGSATWPSRSARSWPPAARWRWSARGRSVRGWGGSGLTRRPDNLRQLQAAAAVGQAYLIRAYDEGLRRHGRHAAQLLLTHEDFDSRPRYLNMRNTLTALFEWDAVPVINENDTISVDEIKFGDNDRLAAMVTNLLQSPLAGHPERGRRPLPHRPRLGRGLGEPIRLVPNLDDEVLGLAGTSRSALGTGGMRSKLEAARLGHPGGGIGDHRLGQARRAVDPDPGRASRSAPSSSPEARTQGARKRWIGLTARPRGHFVVDAGARRALEAGTQEPAGHRHRRGRRRVRQGRRRRHPRRRRARVRPRPDQLRHRRGPADPGPPHRAGQAGARPGPLRRGGPPRQPGPHPLTGDPAGASMILPGPKSDPGRPRNQPGRGQGIMTSANSNGTSVAARARL